MEDLQAPAPLSTTLWTLGKVSNLSESRLHHLYNENADQSRDMQLTWLL